VVGTGTLTAAAIALVSTQAPTAYACSRGEFDPIADSDVIVEGRYVAYESTPNPPKVYEDEKTGGTFTQPPSVTETIELAVGRVLKGNVTGPSVTIMNSAWVEHPGGGYCGSQAFDPTGKQVIAGLTRLEDGTYTYYYTFFYGDGLAGPDYDLALERLAELPTLGSGPRGRDGSVPAMPVAIAIAGAALVASGGAIAFAQRRRAN